MAETKGFNLGDLLKDVSSLDTGANAAAPQQIELIPLDLIDHDPNNFYSLDGIDQLAASIELVGLQQPILVRPSGNGRYTVISGHRRRAAAMLIQDGGSEQFKDGVPCIVDRAEASESLRELQLIYANSGTRILSSAELNKQAARVEMLLYKLKEQGMDFPGRMRDHVAEACKLSKTKLARLKVIRDKLDPCFKPDYDKGNLSESVAYALAQQPAEAQRLIKKYEASGRDGCKYLGEYTVKRIADWHKSITAKPCAKDKLPCSHINAMLEQSCGKNYALCKNYTCCNDCYQLESCKAACPKLAEKVKKLKADKKAAAAQAKLTQAERERPDVELIAALWQRFGEARRAANVSVRNFRAAENVYYDSAVDENFKRHEEGKEKITVNTILPYGWSMDMSDVKRLLVAAEMFGCSLDYLLCRTDKPELPTEQATAPQWQTGTPSEAGLYVGKFDCGGVIIKNIAEYWPHLRGFYFPSGASIAADCIGWIKLPEEG